MTTPWHKAVRDFWQERTRTALVVLAIALGISGFFAVMASYAILTRELDLGYLATNPASATLRTDAVDDELVSAILSGHGVSDAEPRKVISGRIKTGPVEWRGLTLFVVKDYANIRVSKLNPERGAWPPAVGEILIERDAFQVAKAKIGDTVTVKLPSGVEQTLRISGSVHDVGQAQARMENSVYGYIILETLAQLGETPVLDQLKILVAENRFDEAHIRSVTEDVKNLIESRGHPVRRVDIPPPGKHPHADITGLLLLSMSSFGIFVLLLSGILVVNLLTALMASQIRQIGMMKAVGGTRLQIAAIYFGQALLLGIAALVVSVPLGMLGARGLCSYMAVFLNFDITSFAVPLWVYVLVVAIGIVVPLLAAAYPIFKGSGISVRDALDDFGVAHSVFGVGAFDRLLSGIGGVTRPMLLAIRNSFRRRMRLALTLLTLATGGVFFMTALNIRASMVNTLDRMFNARKYDLTVSIGLPVSYKAVERAARKTPGVTAVEGWFATEGFLPAPTDAPANTAPHAGGSGGLHCGGAGGGLGADRFIVFALLPESQMLQPNIVEGRWLNSTDEDAIVLNTAAAAKVPQMKVGSTITFRMGPAQTTWKIVGIVREPFSPPVTYIPMSFIAARHPGMASYIPLKLEKTDAASINAVKAALEKNLEAEGIRALGSMSKADGRYGFDQHMLMIYVFLVVMSAILAAVGGLGLMTTMSLNVLERRREMGVLRAIGASPRVVWLIVVAEGIVTGTLSWALASLAAWPVSKAIGNALVSAFFRSGLDFSFELAGPAVWLAVSIFLGVVASCVPAWRAARLTVREALAYA